MKLRIIGDVHGKFKQYRKRTRHVEYSLQVGDFGFRGEHLRHLEYRNSDKHKVLFGNHDDYAFLNKPHSMGNFGMFHNVFCIRGAYSIDQHMRTEGVSWWREEQMTYAEMLKAMDAYGEEKPNIVVTHDCPEFLYPHMGYLPEKRNNTSQFLSRIWEVHAPKLWIYGHHHISNTRMWGNTKFICLNELEYIDLDTDTLEYI